MARSKLEEKMYRVIKYLYIVEDVKDVSYTIPYDMLEQAIRRETDIWLSSQIRDFIKSMVAKGYLDVVSPRVYRLTSLAISLVMPRQNGGTQTGGTESKPQVK